MYHTAGFYGTRSSMIKIHLILDSNSKYYNSCFSQMKTYHDIFPTWPRISVSSLMPYVWRIIIYVMVRTSSFDMPHGTIVCNERISEKKEHTIYMTWIALSILEEISSPMFLKNQRPWENHHLGLLMSSSNENWLIGTFSLTHDHDDDDTELST